MHKLKPKNMFLKHGFCFDEKLRVISSRSSLFIQASIPAKFVQPARWRLDCERDRVCHRCCRVHRSSNQARSQFQEQTDQIFNGRENHEQDHRVPPGSAMRRDHDSYHLPLPHRRLSHSARITIWRWEIAKILKNTVWITLQPFTVAYSPIYGHENKIAPFITHLQTHAHPPISSCFWLSSTSWSPFLFTLPSKCRLELPKFLS